MPRLWIAARIATLTLVAPWAYAAEPPAKADPGSDSIALLETVIRAKARDKASAEEVAKAYMRVAQLHDGRGDAKAASLARERMVEWFDAQAGDRDGGPIAGLVAEARFKLILPAVERELARRLVVDGKPVADARKVWDAWHETVTGAPRAAAAAKEAKGPRAKALADQVLAVAGYRAAGWARTAALHAGRLYGTLAREVGALAPLEAVEVQTELVEASKRYRDQAADIWERAWKEADSAGQRDGAANEIRKELSVIKPAEYPPLDKIRDEALTPQQKEASRLAGLAMQTDKLPLRVLYLRKAASLDPDNPQFKELLRAAEAELQASQQK